MDRAETIRKWLTSIVYIAVGVMLFLVLLRTYKYEKPIGDGAVASLEYVNRPCDAKDANGLRLKPGTICSVNKMTADIGDIAKASAIQVQQGGVLVAAAAQTIQGVAADVRGVVVSLNGTATALTGTATAATGLLNTANTTVAASKPVLDNASAFIGHLDEETQPLIGRATLFAEDADTFTKTLPPLSANLTTITGNIGQTTGDFQLKFHAFLFPPPCVGMKCKVAEFYNGAVVASKFIEPAYYFRQLLTGDLIKVDGPVTVKPATQKP